MVRLLARRSCVAALWMFLVAGSLIPPATSKATLSPATASPVTSGPTTTTVVALRANFNNQLTLIRVHFSDPTAMPTSSTSTTETCNMLLEDQTVLLLGTNPQCVWSGPKRLDIIFGPGFTFPLDESVMIKDGVISSAVGTNRGVVPAEELYPSTPEILPAVTMSIIQPGIVGQCDQGVTIGAILSGNAGKPFQTISWSYVESDTDVALTTQEEGQLTEQASNAQGNPNLNIAIQFLPQPGTYTFGLSVVNWVNEEAVGEVIVTRRDEIVPVLSFPSGTEIRHKIDRRLRIRMQASVPSCGGGGGGGGGGGNLNSNYTVRGEWDQVMGPEVERNDEGGYSMELRVEPFTFTPHITYVFQFSASAYNSLNEEVGLRSEANFTVTIRDQPVVAGIRGGSSRRVSNRDRDSRKFYLLEFDGDPSYDPLYDHMSDEYPMNFVWYSQKTGESPVLLANSSTKSSVLVNTSAFEVDIQYLIILNVSTVGTPSLRTASTVQRLIVKNLTVPQVEIQIPRKAGDGKVNAEKPLRIKTRLKGVSEEDARQATYLWESESINFTMASNLRSPMNQPNLVVDPSALVGGAEYNFFVIVTVPGYTGQGEAEITIETNSAPLLGECYSSPTYGTALTTAFRLECKDWTDEDLPLEYEFRLALTNGGVLNVCSRRRLNYYDTLLPEPEVGQTNSTVRAYVYDALGAVVTTSFSIKIEPSPLDIESQKGFISQRLREGDSQSFSMLAVGTLSYIKSSNTSTVNTTTARGIRKSALTDLKQLQSSSEPSFITSLVLAASDFRDPEEVNDFEFQSLALNLLQDAVTASIAAQSSSTTSSDTSSSLSDADIVSSCTAVANVLSVSNATGTSGTEQFRNLTATVDSLLSQLTTALVQDAVAGESSLTADSSIENRAGVHIAARIVSGSDAATDISTGSGSVQATINSAISATVGDDSYTGTIDDSTEVQIELVAIENASLYPSVGASNASAPGLTFVRLKNGTTGTALPVNNSNVSVALTVPGQTTNTSGGTPTCFYWSDTDQAWRTDGVAVVETSASGTVTCNTTHLTVFTSDVVFEINVVQIDASDVMDTRAYDPRKNEMMAVALGVLGLLFVMFPLAAWYDNRLAVHDEGAHFEKSFWRRFNRRRENLNDKGNMGIFRRQAFWAVQRRHVWLAPLIRPRGDYLNSQKRLIMLVLFLLNVTVVAALLSSDEQALPFLSSTASFAIFCVLLSFPIPFVWAQLFFRAPPPSMRVKLLKESAMTSITAFFVLVLAMCYDTYDPGEENDLAGFEIEYEGEEELKGAFQEEDDDDGTRSMRNSPVARGALGMTGTGLAMGAAQARGKAKVKAGKDLEKEEFSKTAADGSKKEGKECDKKMAGNDAKKVSGSAAAASPQTDRKADSKTTPLAESGSAVTETLVELGNTTNAESTGLRVRSEKTTETDLDFLTEQSLGEAWRRSRTDSRDSSSAVDTALSRLLAKSMGGKQRSQRRGRRYDAVEMTRVDDKERRKKSEAKKAKRAKLRASKMRASAHMLRWRPKSFDAAEQKPIRCICCGGSQMRSKKARLYMRTHDWSARDVLGLFISLIVTIGCLFLLVVISWKLRESDAAITAVATLVAFAQDIGVRLLIIVLMEALMLVPALGREDSASDQDSNDELRFEHRIVSSDVPTFKYDINAVVVTVLEAGRKAGIQKGWKLAAIEGVPVENGAEAREEIHRCHCMYRKFEVKFFVGNVEEKAATKAESKAVAKVQAVAIDIKAEGPGKNVESKVDEKAVKGKMKKDEVVRVVT